MNAETQQNRYAPPETDVGDYVSSEGSVEPADRSARLGAAVIDGMLALLIFVPAGLSIGLNPQALTNPQALLGAGVLASALGMIALIVVTIVLVHRNGQTVGKKMVGVKVVRSNGSRASLGRIFWLRNVVNGIPGAIPIVGNVYVLIDHAFIFGDKRQCLHDKIADTIVVKA